MSYADVLVVMTVVWVVFVTGLLVTSGEEKEEPKINPCPDELSEDDENAIKERNRVDSFRDSVGP